MGVKMVFDMKGRTRTGDFSEQGAEGNTWTNERRSVMILEKAV
jgi:hypothetical protein